MRLCNSSVEAFGRSAQRPRLHKQDAVVSAGAEGAAGWAAEESLHLRCLLWRLHQTNINFCWCQFPQTTQAWHWLHTQTYCINTCTAFLVKLPGTCTDLLSWTISNICPKLNQRVLPISLFGGVGLPWEQTDLNAGRHAILSCYFEKELISSDLLLIYLISSVTIDYFCLYNVLHVVPKNNCAWKMSSCHSVFIPSLLTFVLFTLFILKHFAMLFFFSDSNSWWTEIQHGCLSL